MSKISDKYKIFSVYLLLVLITFSVFWQVRGFDFVNYDDPYTITENPYVRDGISRQSIIWAFSSGGETGDYNPLTWLSHMLNCSVFGLKPAPHHITNLLFHAANAVLLFWVLRFMTGALWPSAFVAALFAVHPLRVESVAWVTERKDVLYGFFWILTMAAYTRYARRPSFICYFVVLLTVTAAMLSKVLSVTLPFVLLLVDYWPLGRLWPDEINHGSTSKISCPRTSLLRLVAEKIPFFFMAAAVSVAAYVVDRIAGSVSSIAKLGMVIRVNNALVSYVQYILKMIWPSNLAVFYPYPGDTLPIWQPIASFVILVVVSVGVIYAGRHRRYLAVGWFWYFGTLVPAIGIVQAGAQAYADRYTYIPLIGLFIIIAWGIPELVAKWRYKKIVLGIMGVVIILVLSVCSFFQTSHWRNTIALCRHGLKVNKNNYVLNNILGITLESQGRFEEAIDHYRKVIEINPDSAETHNNLGNILKSQGKVDEALSHFQQALGGKFDSDEVYKVHNNLGSALFLQGKSEEAMEHYRNALRLRPDYSNAHYNLGTALQTQGKLDEAISHYRQAVESNPDNFEAHYKLGNILKSEGKVDEAISHYRKVLDINPDWPVALNSLAWILATDTNLRDANEAIELAERAAEMTWHKDAYILDTLAAAYAAAGRYDEAITTGQAALEQAQAKQNEKLVNHIRKQLELYRKEKP